MAIMNKGDKRVYFCFWYMNSDMLALGLLKYSPVSYSSVEVGDARKSSRNTAACSLLSRTNIIVMSLDRSTYLV